MKLINFESKIDNFTIKTSIIEIEKDIVIIIGGGKSHIGAVGISFPTASIIEKEKTTTTTSIITLPGHKDDIIAKIFSEKLSKALNRNVVAIAGIHFDNITKEEIDKIVKCSENLCIKIVAYFKDKA